MTYLLERDAARCVGSDVTALSLRASERSIDTSRGPVAAAWSSEGLAGRASEVFAENPPVAQQGAPRIQPLNCSLTSRYQALTPTTAVGADSCSRTLGGRHQEGSSRNSSSGRRAPVFEALGDPHLDHRLPGDTQAPGLTV
jgi:hypothetical protein